MSGEDGVSKSGGEMRGLLERMVDSAWRWRASPPWIAVGFMVQCCAVLICMTVIFFFSVRG